MSDSANNSRSARSSGASGSTSTAESTYSCESCTFHTACLVDMVRHIRTDHARLSFHCGTCNAWFRNERSMLKHRNSAHQTSVLNKAQCDTCFLIFFSVRHLRAHYRTAHPTAFSDFQCCHHCGWTFQRPAEREYHEKNCNKPSHPFKCPVCNVRFGVFNDMLQHIDIFHDKELYPVWLVFGVFLRDRLHLSL